MIMRYSFINVSSCSERFCADTQRYLINLNDHMTVKSDEWEYHTDLYDVLAIPKGSIYSVMQDSSIHESSVLSGCIDVYDVFSTRPEPALYPSQHTDLIRKLFYIAVDIQNRNNPGYGTIKTAVAEAIFASIAAIRMESGQVNPAVQRVINDINSCFTDPEYNVTNTINATGYSSAHIRRLFKKETNLSPIEFLNNRRIDYAKELFWKWKRQIPVKEISLMSGFYDMYYFSRLFKKQSGLSPTEYIDRIIAANTADRALVERDPSLLDLY